MYINTDVCSTDTTPIPILDVERKTIPVFCPWCNRIAGVAEMDVMRLDKISPTYKACRKYVKFIIDGKSFPSCWSSRKR